MNVWLVNPFDSLPGEDARLQRYPRLAAAFSAAGWNATLWTAGFSHVFKRERAPGAAGGPNPWRTVFVPVPPYFSNVSLARVRSHRAFAARFLTLARSKTSAGEIAAPDLIVASTPPPSAAQAALVFARETRCKTIVDIQDAWPETFARLVPLPWRAAREAAARVLFAGAFRRERAILAGADGVSAVAARYLELADAAHSRAPRLLSRLCIDLPPRAERARKAPGDPVKLAYAGSLGRTYDLESAVRAVAAVPDSMLEIAGGGAEEGRLRKLARRCPRITFRGHLGAGALAEMLAGCDIGLVPMAPDAFVGTPGKLADYAAAGLAVANTLPGETQSLIARYSAGFQYEFRSARALEEAVRKAIAEPQKIAEMGANARRMAEEIFPADSACAAFLEFAKEIAGRGADFRKTT